MQRLNEALAHMDDDPEAYNEFIANCKSEEELRRKLLHTFVLPPKLITAGLAIDIEFLTHTTQHKNEEDVYNIRGIIGERRDATGRWLKVDRHPDHIDKQQATQEEVAEWEEYQRMHPESDLVLEHIASPSETPQILDVSYTTSGEVSGYTRTCPPKYELVENIHYLMVEEWEQSKDFEDLVAQNGW